jgi:hypothetical protein
LRADKCALDTRPYPSSLFCRATESVEGFIVSLWIEVSNDAELSPIGEVDVK